MRDEKQNRSEGLWSSSPTKNQIYINRSQTQQSRTVKHFTADMHWWSQVAYLLLVIQRFRNSASSFYWFLTWDMIEFKSCLTNLVYINKPWGFSAIVWRRWHVCFSVLVMLGWCRPADFLVQCDVVLTSGHHAIGERRRDVCIQDLESVRDASTTLHADIPTDDDDNSSPE